MVSTFDNDDDDLCFVTFGVDVFPAENRRGGSLEALDALPFVVPSMKETKNNLSKIPLENILR